MTRLTDLIPQPDLLPDSPRDLLSESGRCGTPLGPALRSRWTFFLARAVTLAGFALTIAAGLFGSPVGSHNFAIIFVWIAWWTALKLLFIPLGGRSWCSICPIPAPGEWIQQGSLVSGKGRGRGLNRRWPKKLNNAWLAVIFFALMGLFSAVILTTPAITAGFLLGLIFLALVLSLVFERRAFCRHICPIGGFSGLYAQLAPLEVRAVDRSICAACQEKACYNGSAAGYGCPWGNFPAALKSNLNCGLCTECLRTCPHANMALRLRPYGAELAAPETPAARLDEAAFNLLMLGRAAAFSAVFLGPWGWLKTAAYSVGSQAWALYAAGFLALVLVVVPGLFALAVKIGLPNGEPLWKAVAQRSRNLLPLGAAAWMAFTVSFAFAKAGYLLPVLSDPFGWGWNIFGTARLAWSPDVAAISPPLQAALLVGGLLWTGRLIQRRPGRTAIPLLTFSLLYSLSILWLLVG